MIKDLIQIFMVNKNSCGNLIIPVKYLSNESSQKIHNLIFHVKITAHDIIILNEMEFGKKDVFLISFLIFLIFNLIILRSS